MKSYFHFLLLAGMALALATCAPGMTQTPTATLPPLPADLVIRGVFEGITPCSSLHRPLPQIPQDTDCELMTWKVILYQDSTTGAPATYVLESTYGVSQANTMIPAGGGTAISMEGNWAISKGTKADPEVDVYQLYSEDSQVAVSLMKMSEDILHVLSMDKTLLVGNAAWSYTLNRTDNRNPVQVAVASEPTLPTRPPIPPAPPGASVLGVFEGRLPCHELVFDLLNLTPFPNCLKLKSRLTLYQSQETGDPNTYAYMGTSTIRQGTWAILQGIKSDPDAVVYQLNPESSQQSVFFLKADENHLFLLDQDQNLLVGNALFSYTLSRIEKNAN